MLSALRDDALSSTATGFAVRVGLPWIRSMPLACVRELSVTIDGAEVAGLRLRLGERRLAPEQLIHETGWWFTQDRVLLEADHELTPGDHEVVVTFRLLVPYLAAGPGGGPLELPLLISGTRALDHLPIPSVSRDVA
jgi:hypothetical protein